MLFSAHASKPSAITNLKGVVGVIVPWISAFTWPIGPLVACWPPHRTMVKMSEFTPHTSALMKELVEATFDRSSSRYSRDAKVAADFSERPFTTLLFTGFNLVGRLVMQAAAQN